MIRFLKDRVDENPRVTGVFWCSCCDANLVNPEDPGSGKFFKIFGHAFDEKRQVFEGDWHPVMFALCIACIEDKIQPVKTPISKSAINAD